MASAVIVPWGRWSAMKSARSLSTPVMKLASRDEGNVELSDREGMVVHVYVWDKIGGEGPRRREVHGGVYKLGPAWGHLLRP